jgi:hypothetical protein
MSLNVSFAVAFPAAGRRRESSGATARRYPQRVTVPPLRPSDGRGPQRPPTRATTKRWIAPGAEAERVTGGVRLALPHPFSFTATNTVTSPSLLAPTELDFAPERTQTHAPPPPLAPRPNLAPFPKLYHRQSKIFLVLSFKAAGDESPKLDPFW